MYLTIINEKSPVISRGFIHQSKNEQLRETVVAVIKSPVALITFISDVKILKLLSYKKLYLNFNLEYRY